MKSDFGATIGNIAQDRRPDGRPGQIIRKTKTTTRIKYSTNHGLSGPLNEETVETDRMLYDGGRIWELHSANPGYTTWQTE